MMKKGVAIQTNCFGNTSNANLDIHMKQLGTNAAFFLTVPGPKMIWQFGELGYDYSINVINTMEQ